MNNLSFIIGFALLIILAGAALWFVMRSMRSKKLSPASRRRIETAWGHVLALQDPVRRVMEADKVLDMALNEAGFHGTLGEKLKVAGPRFRDINSVWNAHKVRNHLAHESGARISDHEASATVNAFKRAIDDLC
jgi:hypothetical protein